MRTLALFLFSAGCTVGTLVDDDGTLIDDGDTLVSADPIPSIPAGVSTFTLEQEVAGQGVERRFLVHTAESFDPNGRTPLLFAFHGNGGVPESFVQELAPMVEGGAVVGVYPEGVAWSWNLGPEASEADDVAFTEAILARLQGTAGIDPTQPVALGFSNGAGMVHELAMESVHFTGIAPIVSHMLANKTPEPGAAQVSVLQMSGTEDSLVPYDGGIGVLDHDFLPAEESSAEWAVHNGCDPVPSERASGPHDLLEWENCDAGHRVVHVRMNDVGHDMPGEIEGGSLSFLLEFLLASRE